MTTDDASGITANDVGGAGDTLSPMEATDSDDLRNDDGDDVVDPPEDWSGVTKFGISEEEQRQGEPLDQRLAEEVPDVTPDDIALADADRVSDDDGSIGSDAALDDPGRHSGQIDGTPEDGDSLFPVVE